MSLEYFPNEVLVYIFSFLTPAFRRIAALTCTRFYEIFGTKNLPCAGISNIDLLSWVEGLGITWTSESFSVLAFHGHLEVLTSLRSKGYSWCELVLLNAVRGKQLETIKFLLSTKCPWNIEAATLAVKQGDLEILKFFHEEGYISPDSDIYDSLMPSAVSAGGGIEIVRYLINNRYRCDERHSQIAAFENTEVFKYLYEMGCPWETGNITEVVNSENLETVKYLYETSPGLFDVDVFGQAIYTGNMEMITYLLEAGCPWKAPTSCEAAAFSNQLDLLKYLHDNGCPWNENSCTSAACNNNIDVLRYLREEGCPWDESACVGAASYGFLETLIYLHDNGCPWDDESTLYASIEVNYPIFKYLLDNDCPIHEDCIRFWIREGNTEAIKNMLDKGIHLDHETLIYLRDPNSHLLHSDRDPCPWAEQWNMSCCVLRALRNNNELVEFLSDYSNL